MVERKMKYITLVFLPSCFPVGIVPPQETTKNIVICKDISTGRGETCDIDGFHGTQCSVTVDTLSLDPTWTGRFSCTNGDSELIFGRVGEWVGCPWVGFYGTFDYSVKVQNGSSVGLLNITFAEN